MRYVIIQQSNNQCVNITEWDGEAPWSPPTGCVFVQDPGHIIQIGDFVGTLDPLTKGEIPPDVAAIIEESRILRIKAEAGAIIEARYPDWKQRNMIARHGELVDKYVFTGSLTDAEEAERLALISVFTWVKAVRHESDLLEADPTREPQWPE
jgi:hypothetical protein